MDQVIQSGIGVNGEGLIERFKRDLHGSLQQCALDPEVVGFKSIACYRTGLDISTNPDLNAMGKDIVITLLKYEVTKTLRLADKSINDVIVTMTLKIAGECGKPGMPDRHLGCFILP